MLLFNALRGIRRPPKRRRGDAPAMHNRSSWHRLLIVEMLEDRTLPSCTLFLVPNEPPPQLVGEPVLWTATASDCGKDLVYQFSVRPAGDDFRVVRDFSPANTFTWGPMQEGTYNIAVMAKQGYQGTDTFSAVVSDAVNPRATGPDAVITPTSNPLVALFSVPPGPSGTVHVEFSVAGHHPDWRSTNELPSVPGKSTNFFVAGLYPVTTYEMRYVVNSHHHDHHSSPLLFTTGAIPPTVVFPTFTVVQPPGPGSDLDQDMLYQRYPGLATTNYTAHPLVTDLQGHVTWYYDVSQSGFLPNFTDLGSSLVPGGTVLVMGTDGDAPLPTSRNVLREIDLAGNPLRETNVAAVNAQLTTLGHDIIYSFTHDVQRLPNGQTAVIGITERTVTINGTSTDYIGMMIVVMNADFQVTWAWDAFDHLDVNRGPVLGEIIQQGDIAPTTAVPRLPAVDWLHLNAVSWSPADGNLVLSIRHQDWVIKVDYRNGDGDGHVIWRLGQDGDFTVNSTDPNPWFSHQHNAHYIDDTTLILFDNGNTRRDSDPNADSRGQVWTLDEQTMTATLLVNVDLGNYSNALGAAQRLSNGNYVFTSGRQGQAPNLFGQSIEVRPDSTKAYVLEVNRTLYRSFRVRTLYQGISDSQDEGDGRAPVAGHHGKPGDASSVAVADLTGDSWPDLAVANRESRNVSILLNDGAWTGPRPGPSGGAPHAGSSLRTVPLATPALSGVLAEEITRLSPSATALVAFPGTTVPLIDGSWALLRSDADMVSTRAALDGMTATRPPAPAPVGARMVAPALLDRLFAELESGWLWDRSADRTWCSDP